MVQAAELLLQERTPRAVAVTRPRGEEVQAAPLVRDLVLPTLRRFESPHDITPRTHLLSNGRYTVMVTAAGSGFSRWNGLAAHPLARGHDAGLLGHLRLPARRSDRRGMVGRLPAERRRRQTDYDVVYSEDRAKITQRDRSLAITLEIVVSPEDDAELRQLTVTNVGSRDREIDFTSYAEVVLAPQAADEAHPAFSNLFVETEFVPELETLLATRRPRSADEPQLWLAHLAAVDGEPTAPLQYESDRARFLGRGRGIRSPLSVIDGGPLSNTAGTVLDPIVSLRQRLAIPRGRTVRIVFTTLVAPSRRKRSRSRRSTASRPRSSERARWPGRRRRSSCITCGSARTKRISSSASPIACCTPIPRPRAAPQLLASNRRGRVRALALRHLRRPSDRPGPHRAGRGARRRAPTAARARVLAHEGDRRRSGDPQRDRQPPTSRACRNPSRTWCERARRPGSVQPWQRGGVFLLRADLVPPQDQILLGAASRVVLLANRGTLSEQLVRLEGPRPGPVPPRLRTPREGAEAVPAPVLALELCERPRRIRGGRPRIRDGSRRGPVDPGSLAQRGCEPGVRLPGLGVRRGHDLVRQQPREQAHALVERSRQ